MSTPTSHTLAEISLMNSLISTVISRFRDAKGRVSLVDAANRRAEQLRHLGQLDLDCQLLQSEGRSMQAQDVYRQIMKIERELELS